MYRKNNKRWKTIMEKLLWWQPVTLLVLMFILGACSYRNASNKNISSSSFGISSISAEEQEEKASDEAMSGESAKQEDKDHEAPLSKEALTAVMAGESIDETLLFSDASPSLKEDEPHVNIADMESIEVEIDTTALFAVKEDGNYISKEEVALYIHEYNKLPSNYITKKQAEEQGWNSKEGNLDMVLPGMSIGGGHFGNYEGKLPEANGRKYYECDIDYTGGFRNAKRIVYSNDGLVFYTEDHYNSFEQLY
ncbi:MAG: ribonuclease domain-containing protein [Johnsonella sp.]|nr:ribonuclease domain-containing protein [Johnsonella sp.]